MKIVADDKIPFLKGVLEPYCDEVLYLPGSKTRPEDVQNADAIITRTRTKCNASLLDESSVKFVATATIGFDHFDTSYLDAKDIKWTNAPGCNSSSVAQYIASTLLNLACDHKMSLAGKTLGIVGVGNVGSKVAAVGLALGMNVLLNDPPRAARESAEQFVSLERILNEADFITLHVPLEDEGIYKTFHLADEVFLSKMKPSAFLINSSRGEVCDNQALKKALKARQIKGAVLDVWENEPELDLELLELVNYGTPHIAGYSYDGKANGTAMSVNALCKFFNLELKDWYPADVPVPEKTSVKIPADGSSEDKLLAAVSVSYNVKDDWQRLKLSPGTFEKQRGDYPLRREFPVFEAESADPEVSKALRLLGFKIKSK
ncbi:MAG: 4-phosphoerythronate dehydrogenase PdxB [Victivallaceae bacterium]